MNIREVEIQVSAFKAQLLHSMNKANAVFNDCYSVEHAPGVSLYAPINGDPYVVVLKGDREATVTEFKPDNQSSGTDKLRARIIAKRFFEEVTQ